MQSYYRSMRGVAVEAPSKSQPVVVHGFEDFSFFAWRGNDPIPGKEGAAPRKIWCICESSTGRSVAYGDTLGEAAQHAAEILSDFGAEFIASLVSSHARMPMLDDLFGGAK